MCCGKSSKPVSLTRTDAYAKTAANMAVMLDIALEGTTYLIYTGTRTGSFHVYGFSTSAPYRVVPGKPFLAANVDLHSANPSRVQGLMDRQENNKFMFDYYEPALQKEAEPLVLEVEDNSSQEFTVIQDFQLENIEPELDYSVLDGNITIASVAIRDNEYSVNDLNKLFVYELEHKNRVSVKGMIETKMSELNETNL